MKGTIADPTVRVRIGRVKGRGVAADTLDATRTRLRYAEWPGNLGFATEIELGECAEHVDA